MLTSNRCRCAYAFCIQTPVCASIDTLWRRRRVGSSGSSGGGWARSPLGLEPKRGARFLALPSQSSAPTGHAGPPLAARAPTPPPPASAGGSFSSACPETPAAADAAAERAHRAWPDHGAEAWPEGAACAAGASAVTAAAFDSAAAAAELAELRARMRLLEARLAAAEAPAYAPCRPAPAAPPGSGAPRGAHQAPETDELAACAEHGDAHPLPRQGSGPGHAAPAAAGPGAGAHSMEAPAAAVAAPGPGAGALAAAAATSADCAAAARAPVAGLTELPPGRPAGGGARAAALCDSAPVAWLAGSAARQVDLAEAGGVPAAAEPAAVCAAPASPAAQPPCAPAPAHGLC